MENVGRETSGVVDGIGRELNKHDVLRDLGTIVSDTTTDLGQRVGHEWTKVTETVSEVTATVSEQVSKINLGGEGGGEPAGSRRMLGDMPPGCFCDMRGYACPLHRGREAWRYSHDFKHHVENNIDPSNMGEKAIGLADPADVPPSVPGARVAATPPVPALIDMSEDTGSSDAAASGGGGGYAAGKSAAEVARLDEAYAILISMLSLIHI